MKRAIVTGATGFVGASLTRRLLQLGHEVHLLLRPEYAAWRIEGIRTNVHLHIVDFSDAPTLQTIIRHIQPDWIFHLAAYGAYSNQANWRQMIETNLTGTANLLEACLATGFEAFINTGSSSEYGFKDYPPSENDWLDPNSHYALTKAAATHFCRFTAQKQQVHVPTLRLYSVYGPYEEPTRLIPILAIKGLQGQLPPLVNPTIARDYVYVEDVNDAYLLAATQPNQELGAVYNVGTGVQTSLDEIVAIARQVLAIEAEPQWGSMPDRAWDTSVWVANNAKIQTDLGWQPRYSVPDGFQEFVNWLAAHPAMQQYYESRLGV
ncbi:MAG: SDR family NAD(P)-dependent oxidoreductase [Chloroflexi bacterium]|nr:SDR family NAD(P)-dependent oxidoreductase [Chloroflexota bacterium]